MTADLNLFPVTFFRDSAATSKSEARHTLASLARLISGATASQKDALPWLKLARFGTRRTVKACLRHDGNVLAISGIEADYDAGRMSFDDAVALLKKQGIASLCYASPSHTKDAPRWRVLCQLSEEMPPTRRSHQMGRLNGLFGGIFAGESWTLRQSYYFGSVAGNPSHRVAMIDGFPIDTHDDLDVIWRDKPGGSGTVADDQTAGQEAREDAELIRCVVTGEHFHVELVALAARYIGRGIPATTVTELLQGIMLSHPDGAPDARWLDRYQDLERVVESAVGKYRGEAALRRRPLVALACRLIRDRLPSNMVRASVMEQAAAAGLSAEDTERILVWAARQELARREAADE